VTLVQDGWTAGPVLVVDGSGVGQGLQWLSLVAIVASLPVVVLVSNVLHELGHALAALAVGYRVRGFIVGGTSADFSRRGGFLQFGRKFGRAATLISPGSGWITGWRGIVTYGGGAAVNLLIVVVTAPASVGWEFRHGVAVQPGAHTYLPVVTVFVFVVNLVFLVANLVPRVHSSGAVSDGRHLLNLIHSRRLVEWIKIGESSVVIDRPRAQVWHFLDDPRNVTSYDHTVERIYQKPGTPAGVGRILVAHLFPVPPSTAGDVVESETVAFDPPRRMMARGARNHSLRVETALRAVGPDSTRLTRTVWLGAKPLAPEHRQRLLETLGEASSRLAQENERIRRMLVPDTTATLAIPGARARRRARARRV
jgi:hypothetical protein